MLTVYTHLISSGVTQTIIHPVYSQGTTSLVVMSANAGIQVTDNSGFRHSPE